MCQNCAVAVACVNHAHNAVLAEKVTGDWAAARLRNTGARVTVSGAENIPSGALLPDKVNEIIVAAL